MKYRTVIFDLDGTLVNSEPGICQSILYATRTLGLPDPTEKVLHAFFGPPLLYSFETILGLSLDKAEQAVELYRADYAREGVYNSSLFDGVTQMLDELRRADIALFIATSKPERFARIFLDKFKIAGYFSGVCAQGQDSRIVGKAAVVGEALRQAGDRLPALMVGDTRHDIQGGAENALDAAGVSWSGTRPEEFTGENLVCVAPTPAYLTNFILQE